MNPTRIFIARCLFWLFVIDMYVSSAVLYGNTIRPVAQSPYFVPVTSTNQAETYSAPVATAYPGNGPATPEVQGPTSGTATQLIDPFTGDFAYTIPLLNVGGYPIDLIYQSGVTVNQEASWVGLGWSLSPGVVNREVRGLPDDFNGDILNTRMHLKPSETNTVGGALGLQVFGLDVLKIGLTLNATVSHNNYTGWGLKAGLDPALSASVGGDAKLGGSLGVSVGIDSREGGYLAPAIGLSAEFEKKHLSDDLQLGVNINSRTGLEEILFGLESKYVWDQSGVEGEYQFASPTYTPFPKIPMYTSSVLFHGTVGGEVNGVHINGAINGSYVKESLSKFTTQKKSYGYLYAQNATESDQLDFNRENDGEYREEIPNLAVTNFTYDLYRVSAYGINEQFRPMRGDIGTVYDPKQTSAGDGMTLGAEVGLGNLVHAGMDITILQNRGASQLWKDDNHILPAFTFTDIVEGNSAYEPVYFKSMGETTPIADEELYQKMGAEEAIKVELHDPDAAQFGQAKMLLSNNIVPDNPYFNTIKKRAPRVTSFNWYTAKEVSELSSAWSNLDMFTTNVTGLSRISDYRKADHISAVDVVTPNGTHYTFGLPAYSIKEKTVTFNAGPSDSGAPDLEEIDGVVQYSNVDASFDNSRGESNYFEETEKPAYAYAWLLTEIYSTDYHDIGMDGPTPDDAGAYTKFSYKLQHQHYRWRTPSGNQTAWQDNVHNAIEEDDVANFQYGEKEIWYLDKIETRNYIAVFVTSDRNDAIGAAGESGGLDMSQRLQKLDVIYLYTAQEYYDADLNDRAPKPISTVHFEYDYSLCENAPGSFDNGGKLTLKKVWINNGSSTKGSQSPYQFNYASNPQYSTSTIDRWGNYKFNDDGAFENERFPYATQNVSAADLNAFAWNLTNIILPTGGELVVEYESDRYAYVQDRPAMQMCKVNSVHTSADLTSTGKTLYYKTDAGLTNSSYIVFTLPEQVETGDRDALYACLAGIDKLYFNVAVRLKEAHEKPEYVSGFADVHFTYEDYNINYGFAESGQAWIKLDPVDGLHPFTKAAFELLRAEMPEAIDDETYPEEDFISALANFAAKLEEVFASGIENYFTQEGFGNRIMDGSFIRLNVPNGNKLGGGSRVRSVRMLDHWGSMQRSGYDEGLDFAYGQTFTYTTIDPLTGKEISSGVAAFEPIVGNDENPFTLPIEYSIVHPLSAELNQHQLEPIGLAFYPAPTVGYSKVTIQGLEYPGVTRTRAGSMIKEYYTAKDFPVVSKQTALDAIPKDLLIPMDLYNKRLNAVTVSQGFVVITNDMHGQLKSEKSLDNMSNIISGAEYIYATNDNGSLNNYLQVVNPESGQLETIQMGITMDAIVDARQYYFETGEYGAGVNVEFMQNGPLPMPIPAIHAKVTEGKSEYRGITITKTIHRNGILSKVISYDNGAVTQTELMARDAITGEVVVKKSSPLTGKETYDVSIPAWWAHAEMGPMYANQHLYHQRTFSGNAFNLPAGGEQYAEGDQLLIASTSLTPEPGTMGFSPFGIHAWVYRVTDGKVWLIDAQGEPLNLPSDNYSVTTLFSGRKNLMGNFIAHYRTLTNPISSPGSQLNLNPANVVWSSAVQFSDFWQTDVAYTRNDEVRTCNCAEETDAFTQVKDIVNFLLNNAARLMPDDTTYMVNDQPVTVVANSGSMVELDIKFDGQPCSVQVSTTDGSSLVGALTNTCKLLWQDVQFDEMGVLCSSPTGFTVGCQKGNAIHVFTPCLTLLNCTETITTSAEVSCGAVGTINPFITGILGKWKPVCSYSFATGITNTGHTETSGLYTHYAPFWVWGNTGGIVKSDNTTGWIRADSIVAMNMFGMYLEVVNVQNHTSSSFYGNGHNLSIGESLNAHYQDIGYDGFEEYNYYIRRMRSGDWNTCFTNGHFMFSDPRDFIDFEEQVEIQDYLTSENTHTGNYSLKVSALKPIRIDKQVWKEAEFAQRGNKNERVVGNHFTLRSADLITDYKPHPGEYIVSVWVHESDLSFSKSTFTQPQLVIEIDGTPTTFSASGPIIDGWQQINGRFLISESHTNISFIMQTADAEVLFDDIRVSPAAASLQTYVYHDKTLQLMAVLDGQNYAMLYEYDSGGSLARKKRESETGVYTLQEYRSGMLKVK